MSIMNIVGFNRFEDLLLQMFKTNQVKSNTIYLALMMTLFLFFFPFFEKWVWSPAWTLIFFGAVVTLDFITAIAASNRGAKKKGKKTGFVTEKATRFVFVLAAYLILFAILHSLGKVIAALGIGEILNPIAFNYLAKFVFFLCFAINFVSALKHMSLMGLIPRQIAKFIEKFIDVHKNIINAEVEAIGEQRKNKDEGDRKPQS